MYANRFVDIQCSICGKEFRDCIREDGKCPQCKAKYTWIKKEGFFEVPCPKCHNFINIEKQKDGTCEFCGTKYKWKKTIPTIFHPEAKDWIAFEPIGELAKGLWFR